MELTRKIINEERENIERIADILLEKETIFTEDIEAVLGKSAHQIAKEETETKSVANGGSDDTDSSQPEIKYVIEPTVEEAETENSDK